jgi:LmbE family N-acetylglucosaminyl deacetylase
VDYKNVLVLSPHTDDAELGCGGFISYLKSCGSDVRVIAFCCPKQILKEFLRSMRFLDVVSNSHDYPIRSLIEHQKTIKQIIYDTNRRDKYDLVLCPCSLDTHMDHKVVHDAAIQTCKNTTIWGYELPWNNHAMIPAPIFFFLSKDHIARKWKALSYYKSQMKKPYFNKDFIFSLAKVRGVMGGSGSLAEMFQMIESRMTGVMYEK